MQQLQRAGADTALTVNGRNLRPLRGMLTRRWDVAGSVMAREQERKPRHRRSKREREIQEALALRKKLHATIEEVQDWHERNPSKYFHYFDTILLDFDDTLIQKWDLKTVDDVRRIPTFLHEDGLNHLLWDWDEVGSHEGASDWWISLLDEPGKIAGVIADLSVKTVDDLIRWLNDRASEKVPV